MLKFFYALAASAAFLTYTTDAEAATVSCGTVTYTATTSDAPTDFCDIGNLNEAGDLTFDSETFELGITDAGTPAMDSPLSWGVDPMSVEGGMGMLDWSINLAADWVGRVVLELKQSSSYALFDVTASCDFATNTCAGLWSTAGPGGSLNDLSHTRAWYQTADVAPVPLPAAGFLFAAGLFGLGGLRRRSKA